MSLLTVSQPLYQQAYETLKKSILMGELPPGSKLVTSKLAEQYEISRTPLREAIRQLQIEGLIVSSGNASLEVVTLDKEDYEQLAHCRLVLEKNIIEFIVEAITDKEVEELEKIIKQSKEACDTEDKMKLLELNTLFHTKLHNSCPNKRLVQLLDQVRSLLLIYRANVVLNQKADKEIINEHQALLQAVKERDAAQALVSIEKHFVNDTIRAVTSMK